MLAKSPVGPVDAPDCHVNRLAFVIVLVPLAFTPVVTGGCSDRSVRAQPKETLPPRLEREKPSPELTRKLLHDQMKEHKTSMTSLLTAALVLDHTRTESLANALAATPAVPRQADSTLGPIDQLVREKFASYQEQMRDRAAALAAAARDHDSSSVAKAYGRLTEVCVGCHATYLEVDVDAKKPVRSPTDLEN